MYYFSYQYVYIICKENQWKLLVDRLSARDQQTAAKPYTPSYSKGGIKMTIFFFGLQNYGDYAYFGDVIDEQLLVNDSCDRLPLYNVYEDLILIQDYLKIGGIY